MATAAPPSPLDAQWLAHRYDPGRDAFHFLQVTREAHRGATFLTDDYLPAGLPAAVLQRREALARATPPAPLHWIVHSAFCCSTLLARALDVPGHAMSLSEPAVLNDLTGWRRRGEPGPDLATVVDDTLTLLGRPFSGGEAVVVKPSTIANGLMPAMLALRADSTAVLLYAPLPTFLASIAKKELEGRLWVRTLLAGMLDDGLASFGYSTREHFAHTDLQVAALAWLGQQALFADLVRRYGPGRVRTLDSATLMQHPRAALAELAMLFGLRLPSATLDAIVAGPAFNRHSKSGAAFDATARAAEHRSAADTHAREIAVVLRWAEQAAAAFGIAPDAPAPLLDQRVSMSP
ncbi:MAG: hypothetical protein DI544_06585 [Sphingomonas taxi]|uniref:Uncharacterized protein n=1 Tax=Sphingomonas taxi TaxID=1549858 RepID=A0A2W5PAR9_9SPHN|nr:MAG: hypothetical protein DI544_06585 [Sphingomonas taxi]